MRKGIDIEAVRIGLTDPVLATLQNLPIMLDAISDLAAHLIVSSCDAFVTSDNPVIKYNQYCEGIEHSGLTGAASKGLQLFVPLSPRHLLVLYDGTTYRATAGRFTRKSGAAMSDIDQLNKMQLMLADEHVYFSDLQQLQDILRLLPEVSNPRDVDHTVVLEYGQDDNPDSSLLHMYEQMENMSLNLTFLRIRGQAQKVPKWDRDQHYRNQPSEGERFSRVPSDSGNDVITFSRFIGRR